MNSKKFSKYFKSFIKYSNEKQTSFFNENLITVDNDNDREFCKSLFEKDYYLNKNNFHQKDNDIYLYLNFLINPHSDLSKLNVNNLLNYFLRIDNSSQSDNINFLKRLLLLNLKKKMPKIFLENQIIFLKWINYSNNLEMIFYPLEKYYFLYNFLKNEFYQLDFEFYKDFNCDELSIISPLTLKILKKHSCLFYVNYDMFLLEQFYLIQTYKQFFDDLIIFENKEDICNKLKTHKFI